MTPLQISIAVLIGLLFLGEVAWFIREIFREKKQGFTKRGLQTWISRSSGKVFPVNSSETLFQVIQEEFESSRCPASQEKARVLLEPRFSQKPKLN